jgi:hypothetical protein
MLLPTHTKYCYSRGSLLSLLILKQNKMIRIVFLAILFTQAINVTAQLNLSPVNTGDCVAPRITSKRTRYMDEYDKKYCAVNKDKALEKKCLENSKLHKDFSFFTDRCSETDYYIGINGNEVQLKKTSKKIRNQHDFIGSFSGNGIRVVIHNPRLVSKSYFKGQPKTEDNVEDAAYKVDVTVNTGKLTKTFTNVVLTYGY